MIRTTVTFITGILCGGILLQQYPAILDTSSSTLTQRQGATVAETVAIRAALPTTIDETIADMTLDEKIGQLFMIGHWRENDFYHTKNMVQAYHLGGIIIMSVDSANVDFVPVWTEKWQDNLNIPLFIAIDQEGGVVSRIRAPGYELRAQRDLTSLEDAHTVGLERGAELANLGINVNLAPVLDTSITPEAFLYDRTFANPAYAVDMATALIAGHRDAEVLTAVKHYPGHLDNQDDSHELLPIIPIARERFTTHTRIFTDVLEQQNIALLMTAHVLLPEVDPVYPATLSPTILGDILRGQKGYDGIIITDDMTMKAITNTYSTAEAAVLALQAGADIILFAAEPNESIDAIAAIKTAVTTGTLSEASIDESVARILRAKQGL